MAAMLQLAAAMMVDRFKLFDRWGHRDPALAHFDCGEAVLGRRLFQEVPGQVRVNRDLPHVEAPAKVANPVLHGAEVDHVAGRRLDEALFGPQRVRSAIALRFLVQTVLGTEKPRVNDVAALPVAPRGHDDSQIRVRRQVHAEPTRLAF